MRPQLPAERHLDGLEAELDAVISRGLIDFNTLWHKAGCRYLDRSRLLGPDERDGSLLGRVHNRTVDLNRGVENTQVVARQRHDLDRRRANFRGTKPGRVKRRRAGAADESHGEDPQANKSGARESGHVQV